MNINWVAENDAGERVLRKIGGMWPVEMIGKPTVLRDNLEDALEMLMRKKDSGKAGVYPGGAPPQVRGMAGNLGGAFLNPQQKDS